MTAALRDPGPVVELQAVLGRGDGEAGTSISGLVPHKAHPEFVPPLDGQVRTVRVAGLHGDATLADPYLTG